MPIPDPHLHDLEQGDKNTFPTVIGRWDHLSTDARPIRHAVFVIEQRIPIEIELDEWDAESLHAVVYTYLPSITHKKSEEQQNNTQRLAIGTARLLPSRYDKDPSIGHIGRMAVLPEWRSRGIGHLMLERLCGQARAQQFSSIVLHAQQRAIPFYARFGFQPTGLPFEEADIPHQAMSIQLFPPKR